MEALPVELAHDLVFEAFRGPMDDQEPDEVLEPGEACCGCLHQAEVEAKAPVLVPLPLARRWGMKVVDEDDRVVPDQLGRELEDRDRLLGVRM